MSHEIEETDSLAYAGATPWHGIGVFVGAEPIDSGEMIERAGLSWRVKKAPCKVSINHRVTGEEITAESEEHFMVLRSFVDDPNKVAIIGTVGRGQTMIQNADMFQEMDQFVSDGSLRYEVAGSLRGGRVVWALARNPAMDFEVVPGDVHKSYLLMCSGHDGKMSLMFRPTDVRVVCNNTMQAALSTGAGDGFKTKHTKNWQDRLTAARDGYLQAQEENISFQEVMKTLAAKQISPVQAQEVLSELLPIPEGKRVARAEAAHAKVRELMEDGMGTHLNGVKGTAYGFLNAITEYTHHQRTYKDTSKTRNQGGNTADENKVLSIWNGGSAKLAQKATSLLLSL